MRALSSIVMFSPGQGRLMARIAIVATAMLVAAACGGAATDTTSSAASDTPVTETSVAGENTDAAEATPDTSASETAAPEAAATDSILVGEYPTMDGQTIDLASLQGNDVVLWFWAPW